MSVHADISPAEAADRLAIRELVEAYAHCADRRDAKGQISLFTPDSHFAVYMNAKDPTPSQELHSREALAPVFENLNQYALRRTSSDRPLSQRLRRIAPAESCCLADHITIRGAKRRLMLASLRYLDTFAKVNGTWLFAERLLYVDWQEERELS